MTAEHGIAVDQSAVHRWAIKLPPVLEKAFRRCKRAVGERWRMDETYVKIRSEWMCLYPAVDKEGNTVDFLLRASGTRLLPSVISKIDPAKRRTGDGDDRQKRS
jgi:putative transposase